MKVSGIYKIINKTNGKYYIGSSNNIIGIRGRWANHVHYLNNNKHQNRHLQRAWNKYGVDAFDFTILEKALPESLLEIEQKYLNEAAREKIKCYNMSFIAGKIEMTSEVKKKISESLKGIKRPYKPCKPSDVAKRVESRKWYKHHSKKTRDKISKARMGYVNSPESIQRMREKLKGRKPWNVHQTIYTFTNRITNEIFVGIKSDFIKKYSLFKQPVYLMINGNGRLKSYKGWTVIR
jgi:group I intron endonuclease